MISSTKWLLRVAFAAGGLLAGGLTTPSDPLIRIRLSSMRASRPGSPATRRASRTGARGRRDCARRRSSCVRTWTSGARRSWLRAWSSGRRFLQIARWKVCEPFVACRRTCAPSPALSEIDHSRAIAKAPPGPAAGRRRRGAELARRPPALRARLRRHGSLAVEAWRRAFPVADRDGERFYVLHELEQERPGNVIASFPADVSLATGPLVEEQSAHAASGTGRSPDDAEPASRPGRHPSPESTVIALPLLLVLAAAADHTPQRHRQPAHEVDSGPTTCFRAGRGLPHRAARGRAGPQDRDHDRAGRRSTRPARRKRWRARRDLRVFRRASSRCEPGRRSRSPLEPAADDLHACSSWRRHTVLMHLEATGLSKVTFTLHVPQARPLRPHLHHARSE